MFGNPLYRGVVIRWNRWSDIRGGTHNGAAGVRLDDMISGVTVHGTLFERCGTVLFRGVQVHGGKENLIDGNLFLDCQAGISFTRWGPNAGWKPSSGSSRRQARIPMRAATPRWPASKPRRILTLSAALSSSAVRASFCGTAACSRRYSMPRQRSPWICEPGRRRGLGATIRNSGPCSSSHSQWRRWDPTHTRGESVPDSA